MPLFDRPLHGDVLLRVWLLIIFVVALLELPTYVDWNKPWRADLVAAYIGLVLLWAGLLFLLLALLPALYRRHARAGFLSRGGNRGPTGFANGRAQPAGATGGRYRTASPSAYGQQGSGARTPHSFGLGQTTTETSASSGNKSPAFHTVHV